MLKASAYWDLLPLVGVVSDCVVEVVEISLLFILSEASFSNSV